MSVGRERLILLAVVVGCGLGFAQARAQENVERGRTPAQLYASDCADCHRNPRVVGKTMSSGALTDYLRLHYTASKETAAAIAAYLTALPADPRAGATRPASPKPGASGQAGAKSRQAAPAKPAEPASAAPASAAPETPQAIPPAVPKPAEGETKPASGDN